MQRDILFFCSSSRSQLDATTGTSLHVILIRSLISSFSFSAWCWAIICTFSALDWGGVRPHSVHTQRTTLSSYFRTARDHHEMLSLLRRHIHFLLSTYRLLAAHCKSLKPRQAESWTANKQRLRLMMCPAHKTTHRVLYKFPSFSIHKLASKCMWRWAHVFTTGTFLCVTFPSFNAPASTCLLYRRRRRRRRKSF